MPRIAGFFYVRWIVKNKMLLLWVLLFSLPYQGYATEHIHRSSVAKRDFQRANPCPGTGERRGRCAGYVIDHVVPLCAGGPDTPANMQWQAIAESKVKDREERQQCRAIRLMKSF